MTVTVRIDEPVLNALADCPVEAFAPASPALQNAEKSTLPEAELVALRVSVCVVDRS